MQAALRLDTGNRLRTASLAMGMAATVALVPSAITAAQAATAPAIVQQAEGAATAVANWLAGSGLSLVQNPITGLTTIVGNVGSDVAGLGGDLATAGQSVVESLPGVVTGLQTAAQDAAGGNLANAWTDGFNALFGPVVTAGFPLLGSPTLANIFSQLGPIGDGLSAAISDGGLGLALLPVNLATSVPPALLSALTGAAATLAGGDPFGAAESAITAGESAITSTLDQIAGQYGAVQSLIALVPQILSAMASSSWATSGPLGGVLGAANINSADVGSSAPSIPGLSTLIGDAQLIGSVLSTTAQAVEQQAVSGLPTLAQSVQTLLSGDYPDAYAQAAGAVTAPVLLGLLSLVGGLAPLNSQLGPIGAGLNQLMQAPASGLDYAPGVAVGLAVNNLLTNFPAQVLTAVQNVQNSLGTLDPSQVFSAVQAGLTSVSTNLTTDLFGSQPYDGGVLTELANSVQAIVTGAVGSIVPAAVAGPSVAPATQSLVASATSVPNFSSAADRSAAVDATTKITPAASGEKPAASQEQTPATGVGSATSGTGTTGASESPSTGSASGAGTSGSGAEAAGAAGTSSGAGSSGTGTGTGTGTSGAGTAGAGSSGSGSSGTGAGAAGAGSAGAGASGAGSAGAGAAGAGAGSAGAGTASGAGSSSAGAGGSAGSSSSSGGASAGASSHGSGGASKGGGAA
jgi:hypothetical protein